MPTLDFYSASTYHILGIDVDLFTPIFAVSRISGWTAHVIEQLDDNRLIRPRASIWGRIIPIGTCPSNRGRRRRQIMNAWTYEVRDIIRC